MSKLRVLDLFSGIGGFSLGLERTGGFETVAFCEIEPFPRRVLAKHWPEVPCYDDVRTLTAECLAADGISVDVICGGFPCQDISTAGSGAGIDGSRSGLWSEYARLIGELRPQFVIVENVAALLGRGLDRVLGHMAALGFDAEWHCIPAADVGAPHIRDRVWIIAYPQRPDAYRVGSHRAAEHDWRAQLRHEQGCLVGSLGRHVADTQRQRSPIGTANQVSEGAVCYSNGDRSRGKVGRLKFQSGAPGGGQDVADTIGVGQPGSRQHGDARDSAQGGQGQATDAVHGCIGDIWRTEPDVGRVANGVPARVDRLKSLGNAVVPQIPELIGNAILSSIRQTEAA